ncbi:hypothetical protein GC173_17180 [bacterium]|nr:hypothetical protein [bacterium]
MAAKKHNDRLKEYIRENGLDLVRRALKQAGSELKRKDSRHDTCRCPWREDNEPSLDILTVRDGSSRPGGFIDRGTGEKGDAFDLCGKLWGLDPKTQFPELLIRCGSLLGLTTEEATPKARKAAAKPKPQVERRDLTPDYRDALARSYGLEWSDFAQAGCTTGDRFVPALGASVPCILYPATGTDGPIEKAKTAHRYREESTGVTVAPPPEGKRHSVGKGTGLFPAFELTRKAEEGAVLVYTGGEEKELVARTAGFRAVSFTHGEKAPAKELVELLRSLGFTVVIVAFDADEAGRKGTEAAVAAFAAGGFRQIRALVWPEGTPNKWDLCDLARERGLPAVRELLDAAPVVSARPQVIISGRQRRDICEDVRNVLRTLNEGKRGPRVFVWQCRLIELEETAIGADVLLRIRPFDRHRLRGLLIRHADFVVTTRGGVAPAGKVPDDLVEDALLATDLVPPLEAVVYSPIVSRSGRLIIAQGYHPEDRVFLDSDLGASMPAIPERPTGSEVEAAVGLLEETVCDFPFSDRPSLVHFMAAVLTIVARQLIEGPTPLFIIVAPSPGSGKSLLASVISLAAVGTLATPTTLSKREEEQRKALFSLALRAVPLVLIDNADHGILDSAALASMLTAAVFEDRLLGGNTVASVPIRSLWILTGNGVTLSREITRRAVLISLDPAQPRPWDRAGFKHPDLVGYLRQTRPLIVAAVLTLVQNWIAKGRPLCTTRRMGSFESWVSVVGGILNAAGVDGFLGNRDAMFEALDAEGATWRVFLLAWYDRFSYAEVIPKELAEVASSLDILDDLIGPGNGGSRSNATRLGHRLRKAVGLMQDDFVIRSRQGRQGNVYWLERGTSPPPADLFRHGSAPSSAPLDPHKTGSTSASAEPADVSAWSLRTRENGNPLDARAAYTRGGTPTGKHQQVQQSSKSPMESASGVPNLPPNPRGTSERFSVPGRLADDPDGREDDPTHRTGWV